MDEEIYYDMSKWYNYYNAILSKDDEKECIQYLDTAISDGLLDIPMLLSAPELLAHEKSIQKLLKKNKKYMEY